MTLDIFTYIDRAGVAIRKALEVGVYSYETSAVRLLMARGVSCDLYEAIPDFCAEISKKIANFPNVHLHGVAVSNYQGTMTLCMAGPSTFNASQSSSPAINHDCLDKNAVSSLDVPCVKMSDIDPGDYDFVSIDVEGGEYSILEGMKSRPRVISIETQSRDYINPRLGAITDWMVENNYEVWLWNDTDTVFVKDVRPSAGFLQDVRAWWHNQRYYAGRL